MVEMVFSASALSLASAEPQPRAAWKKVADPDEEKMEEGLVAVVRSEGEHVEVWGMLVPQRRPD